MWAPCGCPASALAASTKLSMPPGPCVRSVRLIWSMQCGIQFTISALTRPVPERAVDPVAPGVDWQEVDQFRFGHDLHVQRRVGAGVAVVERQLQLVGAGRRERGRGDRRRRVCERDGAGAGHLAPGRFRRRSRRLRRRRGRGTGRRAPGRSSPRWRAVAGVPIQVGPAGHHRDAVGARDGGQRRGLRRGRADGALDDRNGHERRRGRLPHRLQHLAPGHRRRRVVVARGRGGRRGGHTCGSPPWPARARAPL